MQCEASIWTHKIIRRQDLTPESALAEAQQIIANYKTIKHAELPDATQFIGSFTLPGGGIVVHKWRKPHSVSMSIIECYFVSQDQARRIFTYDFEVDDESLKMAEGL